VIRNSGVKINHIFVIFDLNLPIPYTTFMGLQFHSHFTAVNHCYHSTLI